MSRVNSVVPTNFYHCYSLSKPATWNTIRVHVSNLVKTNKGKITLIQSASISPNLDFFWFLDFLESPFFVDRNMSFLAGLTGCCIGLLTKLYSNSLRKLPYMRGKAVFILILSYLHFL